MPRLSCLSRRSRLPVGLLFALAAGAGCGRGITALHVLPAGAGGVIGTAGAAAAAPDTQGGDFYDLPFPSDLRLRPDGTFDLSGYPHQTGQIALYVQAMDGHISGAGPGAGIYFRFDGPLDPASLPDGPESSRSSGSSVFVADITEGSPTYGQRTPVQVSFSPEGGKFIGPNWLAILPFPGLPLRERTTYAAILTGDLRADGGGPVYRHPDLSRLLGDDAPAADEPALSAAWARYAPLRTFLARDFRRSAVVGATVFTTQDATTMMLRLRQVTYEQAPPPEVADLAFVRDHDGLCHIYHGTYLSPNFQQGDPPYLAGGGTIAVDSHGDPRLVRIERLRFALSVPNAPMPAGGWPVALYAHGTGGDYESFINEEIDLRAANIELGGKLVSHLAVISIDQVLHGPRDPTGSSPDLTFFNLKNIAAARDNPRQGAADDFQLIRLVKRFVVSAAPVTGRPIRFDENRIYFVGHSQGGLTGPLFISAEPEVRAAVLSGAGAVLVQSLLHKTKPANIADLVGAVLQEPATLEHPFLNLLQAYFEVSDPNNYGRLFFREPPPGFVPKSIFQTLGVVDHYTPVPNIAAFALSMGVTPAGRQLVDIGGLDLIGLAPVMAPLAGNVAEGKATAVLHQYAQKGDRDGHFVIFDQWDARHDWSRFLGTDITSGLAQLP